MDTYESTGYCNLSSIQTQHPTNTVQGNYTQLEVFRSGGRWAELNLDFFQT